jgi:hypothetical protein
MQTPPITVLTCADERFAASVQASLSSLRRLGYRGVVYNLGGLGFGIPYPVTSELLEQKTVVSSNGFWFKSCVYKPEIISHCLQHIGESLVVYLDGDAVMLDRVDELAGIDFDIGVTLRRNEEREFDRQAGKSCAGFRHAANAGVLFFRNSPQTRFFVSRWAELSAEMQTDQGALNRLIEEAGIPAHGNSGTVATALVKGFPTNIYNYYYFDDEPQPSSSPKILHFKHKYQDVFSGLLDMYQESR